MNGRTRGGRGSVESSETLKVSQILASRLQRVANTGRASRVFMRRVDKHLSRQLVKRATSMLRELDFLMQTHRGMDVKEEMGVSYVQLTDVVSSLKDMERKGYTMLIQFGGRVNFKKLERLIDTDSEIASVLSALSDTVERLSGKRKVERQDVTSLRESLTYLDNLVANREEIVEG